MLSLRKILFASAISILLSMPKMTLADGTCSFIASDSACQNAAIGSACDTNGTEGVCVPKSRTAGIIACVCVAGKPQKTHKCKNDYRWSPVKNQCLKPMGQSPDGSVVCIPPYYWYAPDKNCEILFQ